MLGFSIKESIINKQGEFQRNFIINRLNYKAFTSKLLSGRKVSKRGKNNKPILNTLSSETIFSTSYEILFFKNQIFFPSVQFLPLLFIPSISHVFHAVLLQSDALFPDISFVFLFLKWKNLNKNLHFHKSDKRMCYFFIYFQLQHWIYKAIAPYSPTKAKNQNECIKFIESSTANKRKKERSSSESDS